MHNAGEPIPASKLGAIFDPFRQVDGNGVRSRNPRSMGLGLYIARAIVCAHGGTIGVTSDRGGTSFTLTLPRAAPRGRGPVDALASGRDSSRF